MPLLLPTSLAVASVSAAILTAVDVQGVPVVSCDLSLCSNVWSLLLLASIARVPIVVDIYSVNVFSIDSCVPVVGISLMFQLSLVLLSCRSDFDVFLLLL